MTASFVTLVLILAQPAPGLNLVRVPLNEVALDALRTVDVTPVVLLSDAVIVEAAEPAVAALAGQNIEHHVLLDGAAYAAARATHTCYLVTPPLGAKTRADRELLEHHGRVLAEDECSFLFLTDPLFHLSPASARYKLAAIEFAPIALPRDLGIGPRAAGTPLLARHFVIDTILGRITLGEVMQMLRKFTGEETTTVRGVRDTIASRWTIGRKNSSAVWWLCEKYKNLGLDSVRMDSFTFRYPSNGPYYTDSNVIATRLGRVYPTRYWIIGGHLDSRGDSSVQRPDYPAPGADDNASGAIAALIAAKYMQPFPFRYTVRYIGWNGEEQGLYGSNRHAARARARNDTIMGVLNADMVATDTAGYDSIVIYRGTRPGAIAMADTFFACNQTYGTGLNIRRSSSMAANSDHYSYHIQNYDAVLVIEDGLTPYYHTRNDRVTAPTFDSVYFVKAVKALVATIATLAEPDTAVYDVAVNRIVAPVGDVDSGQTVTPVAEVENLGPTAASFTVRMRIGGDYTETRAKNLSVGQSDTVGFLAWTARLRGTLPVVCTVAMAGDVRPGNNRVADSVNVRVRDVGCARIVVPVGTVDSGTSAVPSCTVRNYGNTTESYSVRMRVASTYDEVVAVDGHAPGTAVFVTFPTWAVGLPRGRYAVTCTTGLAADMVPTNDAQADSVTVGVGDAAVVAIVAPAGTVPPGEVVPRAVLRNCGTVRRPVRAAFTVGGSTPPYQATISLPGLPPGADTTVSFAVWNAVTGTYLARCSVYQAGDVMPANDTVSAALTVRPLVTAGWIELRSMPIAPSLKHEKDGAWLADDGDYVYAAKGNKTPDFYRNNILTDSWQTLAPIPAGREGKAPGKGAVGVVGRDVYAVKGNNTLGFWRYNPDRDSWFQMADIPVGTGKKVKGGSDVVFINSQGQEPDHFYLLKGGGNEFYRYDIAGDSWSALPGAPAGTSGKAKYDKGSWLVERRLPRQGPRVIYCHKAKHHELFVFDTEAGDWLTGQLAGMPFIGSTGRSKRSKDGGSAASLGDYIYALKGGNTREFWQYYVEFDSWHEAEPMPLLGSSGKSKKVKAGADVVGTRDCLYALKGNKTLEFWRYAPAQPRTSSVSRRAARTSGPATAVPIGGLTTSSSARCPVTILDPAGRVLRRTEHSSISETARHLPPGVYFVRQQLIGGSAERADVFKLVVMR
ncbi:Zn-dependent exopeptidase M28 [candidate division WOR-3 bacterium]|nr:Zn-dependent exopeptidase M28 [candidate division WOR-3 bacterium]